MGLNYHRPLHDGGRRHGDGIAVGGTTTVGLNCHRPLHDGGHRHVKGGAVSRGGLRGRDGHLWSHSPATGDDCGHMWWSRRCRRPWLSSLWRHSGVIGPPRTPVVIALAGIGGLRTPEDPRCPRHGGNRGSAGIREVPQTLVVLALTGIGGLRGPARCRRPSLSSP